MKSISFNNEGIEAILDNRKTMTRRPIKPQLKMKLDGVYQRNKRMLWNQYSIKGFLEKCPYGKVGDKLWVKETFRVDNYDGGYDNGVQESGGRDYDAGGALVSYYADNHVFKKMVDGEDYEPEEFYFNKKNIGKKRPLILMPRWASRITLEIVDIKVERVQDISAMDCISEGIKRSDKQEIKERVDDEVNRFKNLWNKIYGKDAWNRNDWCWCVEFRRVK